AVERTVLVLGLLLQDQRAVLDERGEFGGNDQEPAGLQGGAGFGEGNVQARLLRELLDGMRRVGGAGVDDGEVRGRAELLEQRKDGVESARRGAEDRQAGRIVGGTM